MGRIRKKQREKEIGDRERRGIERETERGKISEREKGERERERERKRGPAAQPASAATVSPLSPFTQPPPLPSAKPLSICAVV